MTTAELITEFKDILEQCREADPGGYILGQTLHNRMAVAIEAQPDQEPQDD